MRITVRLRNCFCLLLAAGGLFGRAGGAQAGNPAAAVQFHWAGAEWLSKNPGLATLNKLFDSPATADVQKLFLGAVSRVLAEALGLGTNQETLATFEPLANEVVHAETLGSVNSLAEGAADFCLATKASETEAQSWRNSFDKVFAAGGEKFSINGFDGWRWSKEGANIWMASARGWLVVRANGSQTTADAGYLDQIRQQGRPGKALPGNWLEAEIDSARVAGLRWLKPARIGLTVGSEQDNLRIAAQVVYPAAVAWPTEAWQLPRDLIGNQLISFTTGQNVAAFLNLPPEFSKIEANPLTNHFCAWALKSLPFLSYVEWPVANAPDALARLGAEAPPAFNSELKAFNGTQLVWAPQRKTLGVSGLQIIAPAFTAEPSTNGDFLLFGLFPPPQGKKPIPEEIFKHVGGRTNLVYFDWEATGLRLPQWQMLGRMLLTPKRPPLRGRERARGLMDKWLGGLGPLRNNTITEVLRAAPNELSVTRTGPLGLTGIEIYLCSDWLSNLGGPAIIARPRAP